jgi:hypothetical protein
MQLPHRCAHDRELDTVHHLRLVRRVGSALRAPPRIWPAFRRWLAISRNCPWCHLGRRGGTDCRRQGGGDSVCRNGIRGETESDGGNGATGCVEP